MNSSKRSATAFKIFKPITIVKIIQKCCSKNISSLIIRPKTQNLKQKLEIMLDLSWRMPGQLLKLNQKLTSLEAFYVMSLALSQIIFWPQLNPGCTIITRNRNLFSFISLTLKPLLKFLSEILICCLKNSLQFKLKTRYFLLEVKRKKMI